MHAPEDPDDALRAILAELAVSARRSNLARVDVLAEALDAVEQGRLDETTRSAAVQAAHQLVGSAGTFGAPEASRLAAALEQYLGQGDAPDPAGTGEARRRLVELRRELDLGHQFEE